MRTLLIDNYDSFTFNLFQLLAEVNGAEPIVVRNDEAEWGELARLGFDAVVISPGPGHPARAQDFGVCAAAIAACERPLLGVCLGHQGLGLACGGEVGPAPEPVHGRATAVNHDGAPLLAGIPRRFQAVRYHSLCLREPLPPSLAAIAWADDGVPMAIAHRSRPQWGVQFHPESVATEHGRRLLANFRDLAASVPRRGAPTAAPASPFRRAFSSHGTEKEERKRQGGGPSHPGDPGVSGGAGLKLSWRRLDSGPDPELAFLALYGDSAEAFWLDSGGGPGPRARFSFMGDASGPLACVASYDVDAGELTVRRRRGEGEEVEVRAESVFAWLDRELDRLGAAAAGAAALPFDFRCGFAGYLGYELKAECGGERAHSSPLPDAALVFADRLLAFDHEEDRVYVLCLHEEGAGAEAGAWLSATAERLGTLAGGFAPPPPAAPAATDPLPARPRDRYLADVAACRRHLLAGDSYELCLTNRFEAACEADPLDLYRRLRRLNPAPFAAYLRLGGVAVLSSSPERFLRIDGEGGVEARPIKGTCRRDADPAEDARLAAELRASEKNRAENLMIADLMRNDLGSVCEVGSVEVPALMEVESFATVHQLVSTVRGRLRPGTGPAACVRACFPPGSMTGAPKRRTMEILDRLEGAPRGAYSGAIGYLGLGGGCDLSVAIRTVVLEAGGASVGAGGAIVLGSDPEEEHGEMLLKAAPALRALGAEPGEGRVAQPVPSLRVS